ncbi:rhodanese-like domain-containing protein [Achromobacter aloeverae]|uniref:Thiosulfate sulfurtransferase n=1 Tax=Achromobacter aloeverae TaxID=1750518 RepID=A0A4Q1HD27_9BURK|nr:rhodanese-like domain-containing protein [Achromobacter aloeverae]RXN83786.1 thiosulfate sulfurtransferase [Achromobacter aloeverae]
MDARFAAPRQRAARKEDSGSERRGPGRGDAAAADTATPQSAGPRTVGPAQLRAMLDDGGEFAVLDVREEGVFGRDGHLLLASNLPLSRLERLAPAMLPRREVRIVVCDGGDRDNALARAAAERLVAGGYRRVHVLAGGTAAWRGEGYALYGGLNTYSKAFAEQLAHARELPQATVADLAAWQAQGRRVHMLDCRPAAEFRRMTIPGAINYPGMELAYRAAQLAPADDIVLVNCAGRTRSLMATRTLLEVGLRNPVYALQGGTMGWALDGRELAHGAVSACPPLAPAARAAAAESAQRLADRHGLSYMDLPGLEALRADAGRTVYLFDVRTPEEYAAGHLPGAVGIGGAQLVHALDVWAPVRNAVVVLSDDDGARAVFTAMWLKQMGWHDVRVLRAAAAEFSERGAAAPHAPLNIARVRPALRTPGVAAALMARGDATIIDIEDSMTYKRSHIAGAWHAVRARLADSLPVIASGAPPREWILTCADGLLARIASAELQALTDTPVSVLEGGTAAWVAAGLPLAEGAERLSGADDDVWLRAHQRAGDTRKAMLEYLDWEEGLVAAVAADADFRFRECLR